ncbi:MAG TPA: NAD(+)/NADH kinase, partial [Actinomycetota bacterium]
MRTVGFVVHPAREAAMAAAKGLTQWLEDRGIEVRWLDHKGAGEARAGSDLGERGMDLVVSVGGDGTFLHAAHVASRAGCPILGVKVGRLGFLTEVEPEQTPPLLERAIAGTARIEERLAVLAEPEGADFEPQWALNEMMIEKRARHRIVR